jgi:hypothetical protein
MITPILSQQKKLGMAIHACHPSYCGKQSRLAKAKARPSLQNNQIEKY